MDFLSLAPEYFKEGYSCSESIARAAVELGLAGDEFVSIATGFSGGMGARCLCGAVAGSQMVLGLLHGKNKDNTARTLAKKFYDRFVENHKVACCKVLSAGFKDFHSPERRLHCVNIVAECASILDKMLSEINEGTLISK